MQIEPAHVKIERFADDFRVEQSMLSGCEYECRFTSSSGVLASAVPVFLKAASLK